MGIARKCNRCGKCFDPFSTDKIFVQFKNPVFMSKESMAEHTVKSYLIESYSPDAWIDLCPECTELFENFMCGADIPKSNESSTDEYIDKLKREIKDLKKENTRLSVIYYELESACNKIEKQRDDLEDSLADAESKIEELKILLDVDEYDDEEAYNKLFDKIKEEIMEALYECDAESLKSRVIDGFYGALYNVRINDMEPRDRGRAEYRTRFCDYASGDVKRAKREVPPEQKKQ